MDRQQLYKIFKFFKKKKEKHLYYQIKYLIIFLKK